MTIGRGFFRKNLAEFDEGFYGGGKRRRLGTSTPL
jgi:hypothetical protein